MTHPLKLWRREHGMTLEALALATGLSKPHLCSVENGRLPGRKTIEALVAHTGLPLGVFFAPAVSPAPGLPAPLAAPPGGEGGVSLNEEAA